MKTILHPDYWVEIPAGEFLIGVSETQRNWIRTSVHEQLGYNRFSITQRQMLDNILEKVRQRIKQANYKLLVIISTPLKLSAEEEALSRQEPFKTIIQLEDTIVSLQSQRSFWLDRFYIARFPITTKQSVEFGTGTPVRDLPGALEGLAKQIVDDPNRPEIRQFIRSTGGQDRDYSTREVTIVVEERALQLCQALGARLPTILEWHKAARGTDGRLYPWGDDWDPEAGYFFRGQAVPKGGWMAGLSRGVSPYSVWGMAGGLPEYVTALQPRQYVTIKGCHPKESSAEMAWFDHILAQAGNGMWVGLRPVLDTWPRQYWRGV